MDRAIRYEFHIGRDGLSIGYAGFFQGNIQRILDKDDTSKSQWLYSVWLARDKLRADQGLDLWPRDVVAANFIQRATVRNKRRTRD